MNKLFVVCALALAVTACGKGRNRNPITNIQQASRDTNLQNAVFQSACRAAPAETLASGVATGLQTSVKSYRVDYRFRGANVTRRLLYFTDADCSNQAISFEEKGEFRIDSDVNKKTNDGGRYIDMTFKNVTARVHSQDGVTIANAVNLCGQRDWTADAQRERDVTANSRQVNCYGGPVPRVDANVYRVDGNTLMLGHSGIEAVPQERRPASLSSRERFEKR